MESTKTNLAIALSFVSILIVGLLFFLEEPKGLIKPFSSFSSEDELGAVPQQMSFETNTLRVFELFRATTTTATSGPISIMGAKKVTFQVSRQAHSSGSSQFYLYVSGRNPDNKNDYIKTPLVLNIASLGMGQDYRIATSTTLNANGTSTISLDMTYNAFNSVKCKVFETTDGQHSCSIWLER